MRLVLDEHLRSVRVSRLEQAVHLSAPAAGFQPASSGRIWYTLYAPYTQSCPTVLRTASAAGSFFCEPHPPVAIFANGNAASDGSSAHPAALRHNLALAKLSRRPRAVAVRMLVVGSRKSGLTG